PTPACTMNVYGQVQFFEARQCGDDVGDHLSQLPAVRWRPREKRWQREIVRWDIVGALARKRLDENVIPRSYLDNRIVQLDGKLFYPEYHQQFVLPDGSLPRQYASWCMASSDNGRSWRRHGMIAYDTTGQL